jgi:proteasome-associated ATPase
LLAKATFTAICDLHGRDKADKDGFILVSGPQLLSKWLGESEAGVREIFDRNRRFYERHGIPGVIAIDEADAILARRGRGVSSDIRDTMVPQFLSKMDGVDSSQAIMFLLTNKPDSLDDAVVREGRIDRHIKVDRPTRQSTPDILSIHLRGTPLSGTDHKEVSGKLVEAIFDPGRVIYEVTLADGKRDRMTFGDVVSGATLAAVPRRAKALAMERCIATGKTEGVRMEEFLKAADLIHQEREGMQDDFAQTEWLDARGIRDNRARFDNVVCGV